MYHYIRANPVPSDTVGRVLSVNPADFEQQMQWAHDHGYRTISMEQLYNAVAGGKSLDRRTVVLTFDDGYADLYATAWPVLHKYGFTATAYIVGSFVGQPNYMTWDQVVELDRAGVNIGAHSLTHPDLTKISAAAANAEIMGSKSMIESHVGHPVLDFCYPSGRFNPSVVAQVRAAGFRDGTTTVGGAYESVATAYIWPRVRIDGRDTLAPFTAKLASGITGYQQFGAKPPPGLVPPGYPPASPFVSPSSSPTPAERQH
jgi:peptidoglycan/xylan/chitin deacetylase (PgdA/CDA1 family)